MKWKILIFISILFFSLLMVFLIKDFGYEREFQSFFSDLIKKLEEMGAVSVFLFILIYISVAVFVFWLPVHTFTIVGGAIFGSFIGALYSMIAIMLGSVISFGISRYISRGLFANFISRRTKWLKNFFYSVKNKGFTIVLILRLIHFIPFRGINYTAGITSISIKDFIFGSFLGLIPAVLFYSYLGSSLVELRPIRIGIALVIAVIFSVFIYLQQNRLIFKGRFKKVFDKFVYLKE